MASPLLVWRDSIYIMASFLGTAGLALMLFQPLITRPPDVVDVLLFHSPAPFSIWGVMAMWAIFVAALLAAFWPRLPLRISYGFGRHSGYGNGGSYTYD